MIDVLLLLILAGVTYYVASEGAWGAATTAMSVILAGLIAMNFFEPICDSMLGGNSYWQARLDVIVLVGLFAAVVSGLRFGADYVSPTYIGVHRMVHESIRWSCGLLAGYVTMAFLLTALHTAALPRDFLGFKPERDNLLSTFSPDKQWLGFTQYVSEKVCRSSPPRIFDGPRFAVGDTTVITNDVWPSFPIRYATRRERGGGGATAARAPVQIKQVAPQQQGAPSF